MDDKDTKINELEQRISEMQLLVIDLIRRVDAIELKSNTKKAGVFLEGANPAYKKWYEDAIKKMHPGGSTK